MVYRKQTRKGGLKKRWYLSAGANIPFIGKTNISMGTSKFKRNLTSAITQVQRNNTEARHFTHTQLDTGQTYSTILTKNLLGAIAKGTGINERQGDVIHVEAIKCRMEIIASTSVQQVHKVRVLVLKSDKEYLGTSINWGSGLGSSEVFRNTAALPQNWMVDARKVNLIYDQVFNFPFQNFSGQRTSIHKDLFIPIKQKFIYKQGSEYSKDYNYYMLFIPIISGGIVGTTSVCDTDLSMDVIFKDA